MCVCEEWELLHRWCTKSGSNCSSVKFLALGACTYDSVLLFTLLATDVDQINDLDLFLSKLGNNRGHLFFWVIQWVPPDNLLHVLFYGVTLYVYTPRGGTK